MFNIARGFFPVSFTIPAFILVVAGYILGALNKFGDIQILAEGIAASWAICLVGLYILGRTREPVEDERAKQLRNFSFGYLSEILLGLTVAVSMIYLYDTSSSASLETLIIVLPACLMTHVVYLKMTIHFDAVEHATGDMKPAYYLITVVALFGSAAVNFIVWL